MIGLPPNRYLISALKPSPGNVLCYHPGLLRKLNPALNFLETFEPLFSLNDKEEILSSWKKGLSGKKTDKEILGLFSDLLMFSEQVPSTLDQNEFRNWFRERKLGLAEIFDQTWNLPHLGSARSVLLPGVQLKGCGRTLNPFSLWFEANSGLLNAIDATISFVHSHLADTTLPLGSSAGVGVLIAGDAFAPAIYVRESDFPRLAQLGPELSSDIQDDFKKKLSEFFGTGDTDSWINLLLGQFASMAYLGANFHSAPDNLLLNGQPLDEEDWLWQKSLDKWAFVFEFLTDEKISLSENPSDVTWERCRLRTGTIPVYEGIIGSFTKAYSFLSINFPDHKILHEKFLSFLKELSGDEKILSFWKEGGKQMKNFSPPDFRIWLGALENDGWTFRLQTLGEEGRFRLHLSRPRPRMGSDLVQSFNEKARPEIIPLMHKMLPVLLASVTVENSAVTNKLNSLIARNSFCLPSLMSADGTMRPNEIEWEKYFEMHLKDDIIGPQTCILGYWDGEREQETSINDVPQLSKKFIPIGLQKTTPSGNFIEIPLKKIVVTMSEG